MGGLVTSGQAAGLAAGNMAVSVLKGTDVRAIPVLLENPSRSIFDYAVMHRFGISPRELPEGSTIVNRPPSILDQYRTEVLGTGAVFLTVSLFLILLSFEVFRRRRVEASLRKSQSALAGILDSVPQGVFWKDREGAYLGCNQVFAKAVGLTDSAVIVGKTDADSSSTRRTRSRPIVPPTSTS